MTTKKGPVPQTLLTPKQAAELLGITEQAVKKKAYRRELPCYQEKHFLRFDREQLLEFLATKFKPAMEP